MGVAGEEQSTRSDTLQKGFYLSRRASGLLLARTYGRLCRLGANSGITVKSPEIENQDVTEVNIISQSDSLREANLQAFVASGLRKYRILSQVAEMVPSITKPKTAVIESVLVEYDANRTHDSFISFLFDENSAMKLDNERTNVWLALEKIVKHELVWGTDDPKVRIVYANGSIREAAVRAIGTVAQNDLERSTSNVITLAPAFVPEPVYLQQHAA